MKTHCLGLGTWLSAIALCHAQADMPSGCGPDERHVPRKVLATRLIAKDTARQIVRHPLSAAHTVLGGASALVCNTSRGLLHKRLGLHLARGPCAPASPNPALIEQGLVPARVALFTAGAEAMAALEQVIDSAQCRIDVLMFTWGDDEIGRAIAQRLAGRASPRLRVRVLVDGCGNLIFGQPGDASAGKVNRTVCWLAHQPHVELIRTRNAFARFDHRKLVIADGQLAWLGGRNFTEPAFLVRHDVSATVSGPPAANLTARFEQFWQDQGGRPGEALPTAPVCNANAAVRMVYTSPTQHELAQAIYHALDCARHHVWLESPFLHDPGVIVRLAKARRRGADVRVVLPDHTDSDISTRANRMTANRLLAAGVRVYLYPGLVHTKALVADGCWAYLGSGNFDPLSLQRNHELGVIFGPGPVVAELEERLFLADFRPEWELHQPLPVSAADCLAEALASLAL